MNAPEALAQIYPSVPAGAWEHRSRHCWRAPHGNEGCSWFVVQIFGETIGQPGPDCDEASIFARLFEVAGGLAAHREACANGMPAVRPNNDANFGVAGRCWWCGKWPDDHEVTS